MNAPSPVSVAAATRLPAETTEQTSTPNAALYATVREWPIGLELTLGEIDLADVLAYDVLRIFGRLYQQHSTNTEVIGDGRN